MTSDHSSDGNGTALFTTPVCPRPPRLPIRKLPAFPAALFCSALCATFCSSPLARLRSGASLFRLLPHLRRALPASKRPCSAAGPRDSLRLARAHRRAHAFAPLRALVRSSFRVLFRTRVRHGCGAHSCPRFRSVCCALSSSPARAPASTTFFPINGLSDLAASRSHASATFPPLAPQPPAPSSSGPSPPHRPPQISAREISLFPFRKKAARSTPARSKRRSPTCHHAPHSAPIRAASCGSTACFRDAPLPLSSHHH